MMSLNQTEPNRLNDVLKWTGDATKLISIEEVTVLAGQALESGHVLGRVEKSCPTSGTAGTNTGNGTCTGVSLGAKVKVGAYTLKCTAAASNGGTFQVKDPDGDLQAPAAVGMAYESEQINFTVNDGTTDFAVNDTFTIPVSEGSGKVKELDPDAVDGSQNAFGILEYPTPQEGSLRSVAFTSGGTYEVVPGDFIIGATSGARAQVVSLTLSNGTWAGGDAAGTLILDNQVGTFEAENLNIGSDSNVAAIAENSAPYAKDTGGTAVVRDAIIDPAYLVWPAGITEDQKEAALAQLKEKGIITRDHA